MALFLDVLYWVGAAAAGLAVLFFLWWRADPKVYEHPVTEIDDERVTKQGYSARKVPDHLDAVVIGAGIGGLFTAAMLARQGKRVLVLEQHTMAGGNTHTFEEHGFEFDTGLHYVGGKVGVKGTQAAKLWDFVTDGGVKWSRMDDVYDRAIRKASGSDGVGGGGGDGGGGVGEGRSREEFPFDADVKKQIAMLKERFPGEEAAIDRYYALMRVAENQSFPLWVVTKLVPKWLVPVMRLIFPKPFALLRRTQADVLNELTDNADLRGVLS